MKTWSWILSLMAAATSVAVAGSPRHTRQFPRTLYFAEIPLVTTYSNGNSWTGWTSRWVDWPLMTDRAIPYQEGYQYRVTWPDLLRTLTEMREGGIDGATFNVAGRNNDNLITAALARGEKLPVMTIPDYPPCPRADGYKTPDKEDEPWFSPAFFNTNGCWFAGKPVVTSYYVFKCTVDEIKERLAYIRKKYGDFHFVPDYSLSSTSRWKGLIRNGKGPTAEDLEKARERLRTVLRYADGARFCGYNDVTDIFDGERSFDADYFRKYLKPLILEVYAEPEFKGKLLAMNVGMGHDNTYVGVQRDSSNGTKTLRDSIACALELDPDFLTFFEWDEWNENTGIRPTLWNSFAARRVVRAMKAQAEGRAPEAPLAGDDPAIPNLILSFRKTLALGDLLRFELLAVPDAAAAGTATARLTLKDETGRHLASLPPVTLNLTRLDERRVAFDTALAGDACAIVPELEVTWNGKTRVWSAGLPFAEVRPTANWDRKWVLMPLRDLIDGAKCTVSPAGFRDGTTRIKVAVDSPQVIDRLEVTDGGDIVYSMSGDEQAAYREDEDHYVFSSMNFCSHYTQKGATMSLEGVSDAEWMLGTKRTRGLSRKLFPQAEYTVDTYFRVLKREATNAVVKLDWPDIGTFRMPLAKVLAEGVYSMAGTNGFCFGVHRFNRQAAFFAPVAAKRAESVADIVPDLPVSVIGGHALTANGKICRAWPIVVGARAGEKVPIRVWSEAQQRAVTVEVDRARVPDLAFDVSGRRTGTVAKGGAGWALNGILGGSTAVATRRNRGGDSRQHCCTEMRRGLPTCAPAVTGEGPDAEMSFDGTGTYFVMPGGVIPTTCAYRFSFEFWPEDPAREQEIFACGTPLLWGTIGYLRLARGGLVHGVGLSLHEYGDAYFWSKKPVKARAWNRLEIVNDVDTIEVFLNGESTGKLPLVQPGRFNANCWFGGRPNRLFKGKVRHVRVQHGVTTQIPYRVSLPSHVPNTMYDHAEPVNLPELLQTTEGRKITSVAEWERRREELLAYFTRNVYGERPVERPADLKFEPVEADRDFPEIQAVRKRVWISFSGPLGAWKFEACAFVPKAASSAKRVPAFLLICNRSLEKFADIDRKVKSGFFPVEELIRRGYAAVVFKNTDLAQDRYLPTFAADGTVQVADPSFETGFYACWAKARTETSWGAISAWAWGASRVLDWLETVPAVDATRVAVVGHSRGGKTSLWAAASDSRFAMACVNNSGCCGAKLNHVAVSQSETIQQDNNNNPHWFARAYRQFNGRDFVLPYDQHWIAALIAPRLLYIASASQDSGAGPWGEFLTARHASPAWELYGKRGLVENHPYRIEDPFQDGCVGYHLRAGAHNLDHYDWARYMDFADRTLMRNPRAASR